MVEKYVKFINKSPYKKRFLQVIKDIGDDQLDGYDCKKLTGTKNHWRIRIGNVRFIFQKTPQGNQIIRVTNRGDAY